MWLARAPLVEQLPALVDLTVVACGVDTREVAHRVKGAFHRQARTPLPGFSDSPGVIEDENEPCDRVGMVRIDLDSTAQGSDPGFNLTTDPVSGTDDCVGFHTVGVLRDGSAG
jgi:hypothetical protein